MSLRIRKILSRFISAHFSFMQTLGNGIFKNSDGIATKLFVNNLISMLPSNYSLHYKSCFRRLQVRLVSSGTKTIAFLGINIWDLFPSEINSFRRRPLSYRNQSIDLHRKSTDWFLYDNGFRHERVKQR